MGQGNGFPQFPPESQVPDGLPSAYPLGPMDYCSTIDRANGVPLIHPKLQGQLAAYGNPKGVPTPTIWSST